MDPIFLCNPPLVVGIPVLRAKDARIPDNPTALFQENENPNFFAIILKYFIQFIIFISEYYLIF